VNSKKEPLSDKCRSTNSAGTVDGQYWQGRNSVVIGEMEDHMRADQMLIELLRSLGQDQVAQTWERTRDRIGFWCE
jgi:hypothetical protein